MAKVITVWHIPTGMAIKNSTTAIVAPCWTQGNVEGTGSSQLLLRNANLGFSTSRLSFDEFKPSNRRLVLACVI